jgi:hypothetical protein
VFEQILGLPAHPLILHTAVVFIPLFGISAIAYVVVPVLRRHIWWLVGLLAIAGAASAYATRASGLAFRERLIRRGQAGGDLLPKLAAHQHFGDMTLWFTLAAAVVTLVLLVVTPNWRRRALAIAPAPRVAAPALRPAEVGGGGSRAAAEPQTATEGRTAPEPAASGTGGTVLRWVLAIATVVLAGISLYYVFRTGDSGARIAWGNS